tara:strand:+ start:1490 stop:1918 length:429 start_codon:yes stop_codon:yes gene_type:complete
MSRALITLYAASDRQRAISWIQKLPHGTRVEFKEAKRTLPQNDRMWAMLTDISVQRKHHVVKYTPEQWKVIFMAACGREFLFIPALEGHGFIPWGQSSSDLSKQEMSDLIEFMFAWGATNGIVWSKQSENPPAYEAMPEGVA